MARPTERSRTHGPRAIFLGVPPHGSARASRLSKLVGRLKRFHTGAAPPPLRDPYSLVLWEQVAYLADDATRLAAFRALERLVGTAPEAILAAPLATLIRVTRTGGPIAVETRALRLRKVALRVADHWDGDLTPVLKLPFEEARRELRKYPSIGKPGAERILMLCGAHARLALDSNAIRVLVRLGYGREQGSYDQTYASVQTAAERELARTVSARRAASIVLRAHGQTICRRSRPQCGACPIQSDCPTGRLLTS